MLDYENWQRSYQSYYTAVTGKIKSDIPMTHEQECHLLILAAAQDLRDELVILSSFVLGEDRDEDYPLGVASVERLKTLSKLLLDFMQYRGMKGRPITITKAAAMIGDGK